MSKPSLWGCWNLVEWPHHLVKSLLGLLVVLLCYARVRGWQGVRTPKAFSLGEGVVEGICSLTLAEGQLWPETQGASSRVPSGQHIVSLQGTRHGEALSLHTWNLLSPPLHYLSPSFGAAWERGTPIFWGPQPVGGPALPGTVVTPGCSTHALLQHPGTFLPLWTSTISIWLRNSISSYQEKWKTKFHKDLYINIL